MKHFTSLCIAALIITRLPLSAQLMPKADYAEEQADSILSLMTLDEKVAQISHIHSWHIFDDKILNEAKLKKMLSAAPRGFVEGFPLTAEQCHRYMPRIEKTVLENSRIKIPIFTIAEALHGSVHEGSTIFPQNIALAATFNPSLAYLRATAISDELHYQGIRQILAPCVDVVRDLRWGRVEECYGEDPWLNALFACEEVRGYLDHGISPMLKHFGPHGNPSGGLNLASVSCGKGELHDVYLYPFKRVVTTLPVQAVMSSYNSWNRTPNSASHYLLTEVLREQWGFRGYVYADWGAVDMIHSFHHAAADASEAAIRAISSGLDVEASSNCYERLPELVREGRISEEIINRAVRRVLAAKIRMGLMASASEQRYPSKGLHQKESVELSRRIAEEAVVLLKNADHLLPLDASRLRSVAVVGPNADQVQFGDYSWSRSNKDGVTPLQGLRAWAVQSGITVNYARGCDLMNRDTALMAEAEEAARKSDVTIVFVGSASASLARDYSGANCGEGFDLSDLALPGGQEQLVRRMYAVGRPVVLVLVTGKPFALSWEKAHLPAILVQWYGGEQSGNVIADVLSGRVNPSGHLSVSFPQSTGHLPVYYNYLPTDKGYYHQHGSPEKPGRDYVFSSPDALWAFGHGLSYTTFEMSNLDCRIGADSVYVSLTVKNSGRCAGKAVPQLYVRDRVSTVVTPVKQLRAFAKPHLQPGDSVRVNLNVAICDLGFTDEEGTYWVEPGEFEFMVGDASDHILLRKTIRIGDEKTVEIAPEPQSVKAAGRNMTVKGTVRDVQATPVAGAEILSGLTGKKVGITDNKGAYSVVVGENEVLTFRKKGYATTRITMNGNAQIQVQMKYSAEE